ncbi:MAG: response regulator [Thermodesulfobacteriota bacterium]|nr:response regulator [Thermodesulfobacteriota bacterium]
MAFQGSILVVDDEIGPRESLRMILKPLYRIHTAANGQEALKYINSEKIDLVTLDLKMPGIPGIDVLREIKKIKNDIEVVIITGYGTLTNAIEAIRYGAVDFISKPFNTAEIISIVSKSVERRKLNLKIKNLIKKIKDLSLLEDGQNQALGNLGESVGLVAGVNEIQQELRESFQQLESFRTQKVSVNYLDFLKVLIYILESKEPYTSGHSERVSFYADFIAQDLNLTSKEKEDLQIATLLHDIGKIGLSNRLLEKVDLSQNESLDIRHHPVKGVRLIEPLAFSHTVTSAIRHHHERWDGRGYPDGLSGEAIPLLARIITLADSYDAMTSDRPYRNGLPTPEVQEEIEKNAGIQFDPYLVSLFVKHFKYKELLSPSFQATVTH